VSPPQAQNLRLLEVTRIAGQAPALVCVLAALPRQTSWFGAMGNFPLLTEGSSGILP
jgi:hypothetical protein